MMAELFIAIFLGHMVGDYLLQNSWMAMNKGASHLKCTVHCLLYTLAVVIFTWPYLHGVGWTLFIFASHYPIDRWSLADKWLMLIRSRSLTDFIENGRKNIPYDDMDTRYANYLSLRGGFTSIVYCAADNTMHLVLMWYGVRLFL